MKISYVLPVYNAQNNIARCIQSLLNQTVKPHEVIVIDDGSADNTLEVVDYYCETEPVLNRATYYERHGAAFCRNFGNDIATGDIIAVCDADIYYKDRGAAITEFFEQETHKDIFYSALHLRSSKNTHEKWLMEAYEWDGKSKPTFSHPTVAYRKEVANKIKYKEQSIETDLYEFFMLDAAEAGYTFGGCQNPLMLKIEGDTNRDREKAREIKQELYNEYGIGVTL